MFSMVKRVYSEWLARQKVRLGRGESWLNFVTKPITAGGIIFLVLDRIGLSPSLNINLLLCMAFLILGSEWLVAYVDERFLSIWKKEADFTNKEISGFKRELFDR